MVNASFDFLVVGEGFVQTVGWEQRGREARGVPDLQNNKIFVGRPGGCLVYLEIIKVSVDRPPRSSAVVCEARWIDNKKQLVVQCVVRLPRSGGESFAQTMG